MTKTELRKMKKPLLLDELREAYPWKPRWWYEYYEQQATKDEIIEKILSA